MNDDDMYVKSDNGKFDEDISSDMLQELKGENVVNVRGQQRKVAARIKQPKRPNNQLPQLTTGGGYMLASQADLRQQASSGVGGPIISNEYKIKQKFFTSRYDKTSRPVHNDSTAMDVYIGMSLYHILDTVRPIYRNLKWGGGMEKFL